ncbi:MAG: Gfo/Idh/MocA family oxidoreductase [Actinobacteria bacterium]|nr:Gfo/Idh/MocA family oxidoreductase [Actinomycetota bacterium]
MQNHIGFGIIGCGAIGDIHAKSINNADSAKLLAVSDIDLEKAKKFSQKYNVKYYQDYKKLLERKDIDVVNICLPSGMHMQSCVDAAEAGKNILCEKPLEVNLDKIDHINEVVRKNKVKLGVVFQKRFQESSRCIKKALEDEKLGRVISGSIYIKYYRSQEYYDSANWRGTWKYDGGGCLMNQGIHDVDLLQWFLGPVKSVYAITDTVAHKRIEVEDIAVAVIRFKNGAKGIIEASTSCYPGFPILLQIYGTLGTIILRDDKITDWKFINPTKEDLDFSKQIINQKKAELEDIDRSDPIAVLKNRHKYQIEDMIRAINNNVAPEITGEEARKSVEIILAIYKSSRTGEEVTLSLG